MQLIVLYKPNSEYSRSVEEYTQSFKRLHSEYLVTLEDVDSIAGSTRAQLYDVMEYPALLAVADDGSLLNMWVGKNLPLMQDVASYLMS